jgi:hypothetical protein
MDSQPVQRRRRSVTGTAEDEADARAAAKLAEADADEGKKQYLKKQRRDALCSKATRISGAFLVVSCTTAIFTLILAYALCENLNMAMSCSDQLRPGDRLPVLATVVALILSIFWSVDVCWAGIVRRRLIALSDKDAMDKKKKENMFDMLGINDDIDVPDAAADMSAFGAKLKADAAAAKKKEEAAQWRKQKKQAAELQRLEKIKDKLTPADLSRMNTP